MALLFRGFFATSFRGYYMETEEGVPTNGMFQFLRYFMDATKTFEPTHVICCWDMGSETFRTEIYDGYKANRPAPPEQLVPQFDLIKEVMTAFDLPNIGIKNYEADDSIGTLTNLYKKDHNVLILSGDHDLLQLVDQNVRVAIMKRGQGNYEVYDAENFFEKKGMYPSQLIDFKGLMGDSADNYPGVKGIGEKTAYKLISEYESVDYLLENMDQLTPNMQKRITNDLDMLHLSRKLAEIKCDLPIQCKLDEAEWNFNPDLVKERLKKLKLNTLVNAI